MHLHVANPCDSLIVYVYTQVSAFCAFVASSVVQSELAGGGPGLVSRSQAAAGWLIFVTVIAMLVEGALMTTRFLNFVFVATAIFKIVVSPPLLPPLTHTSLHIIGVSVSEPHTCGRTDNCLCIYVYLLLQTDYKLNQFVNGCQFINLVIQFLNWLTLFQLSGRTAWKLGEWFGSWVNGLGSWLNGLKAG